MMMLLMFLSFCLSSADQFGVKYFSQVCFDSANVALIDRKTKTCVLER